MSEDDLRTRAVYLVPASGGEARAITEPLREGLRLRAELEVCYQRAVYSGSILPVFWTDALHADMVVFVPAANSRVQVLKVDIARWRLYRVTSGTRNGTPFQEEGLVSGLE